MDDAPAPSAASSASRLAPLACTIAAILIAIAYSMLIAPAIWRAPHPYWATPPVAWEALAAGHLAENGGLPLIYSVGAGLSPYAGGPVLPILLAPIAMIGDRFDLIESYPVVLPKPTMWPLLCVYGMALSYPLFAGIARLGRALGVRRVVVLQAAVLLLVVFPVDVVFGRFEDILALGLVALGLSALVSGRHVVAAIWFALAILTKQYAVLGVPLLLAFAPADKRRSVATAALAAPAAFYGLALAANWGPSSAALFDPPSFPQLGHAALWVGGSVFQTGSPGRYAVFVLAVVLAYALRRETDPSRIVAAFAVVLLARILFEPIGLLYLMGPGTALALTVAFAKRRHAGRATMASALMVATVWWDPEPGMWWAVFYALWLAVAWPALLEVVDAWEARRLPAPDVVAPALDRSPVEPFPVPEAPAEAPAGPRAPA